MTGRRLSAALATAVLTATLAGCGIRSTEVPTDFGAAPSRVPSVASGPDISSRAEWYSVMDQPLQVHDVIA